MKEFLLALQFLTIFPVRLKHIGENSLARSMVYFPLVGALLGLVAGGINIILSCCGFSDLGLSVIVFAALTIFTGGLHLDGLSDTCDGLGCRHDKEKILMAMRDPSTGAFGVAAIVFSLLLKVSLFSSIDHDIKIAALVLMCVVSRYAMVVVTALFPYARREGKARPFIDGINLKIVILSGALTAAIAFFTFQWAGLLIASLALFTGYGFAWFFSKKIHGITGDVLGAVNELCEIVVLALCVIAFQAGYL